MAGLIAEPVRGGGIDPRLRPQENDEADEDANSDEAEIPASENFLETGNHASVLTTRERKSKGKAQNAKRKGKVPRTTFLHNGGSWGFAFCALHFDLFLPLRILTRVSFRA